ncbi:hypothetical protein KCU91_g9422, partial [Aureobasidium melanogenum]
MGDGNQTWTTRGPPESSTAGTETSGSGSTDSSNTPTQAELTRKKLEDLNAFLAKASDTRLSATFRLKDHLSHLALHIKKLQEHHAVYHNQAGSISHAENPADLQMMVHHSQKRREYQAKIQETLDSGSQLIVKARNLLGEKAGLMGIEIDSDEMREWMDEWAGFGLELAQFQRLLNEAIMEGP